MAVAVASWRKAWRGAVCFVRGVSCFYVVYNYGGFLSKVSRGTATHQHASIAGAAAAAAVTGHTIALGVVASGSGSLPG
jgi:uncharacterized protein (DUF697 family)